MEFQTEPRVLHREWEELIVAADDVLAHPEAFSSDDEYEPGDCLDGYPTLVFESGEIVVDEMWGVREGRIWFSSFSGGVSGFRDGEYVHQYHATTRKLGQFLRLEITSDDELRQRLIAA